MGTTTIRTSELVDMTLIAMSDKYDLPKVRIADIALTIGLQHIRDEGITLRAKPNKIVPTFKGQPVNSPLDGIVDDIN